MKSSNDSSATASPPPSSNGPRPDTCSNSQCMRTNDMMLAALLANNLFVGRTMQFQADLEQKIKELTPEVVNAALRKHLDPKRLSAITAGDFKKK